MEGGFDCTFLCHWRGSDFLAAAPSAAMCNQKYQQSDTLIFRARLNFPGFAVPLQALPSPPSD